MNSFDQRVRAEIREGVRLAIPGVLNAKSVQRIACWVLHKLRGEFVVEEKLVTDEPVIWEYRALAKEPDTGEVYDSLGPFLFETEARNEADVQDLLRETSDHALPQLVLFIERRRRASAWEPLP